MSAIFGRFNTDGCPVEVDDLERMQEVLVHRGTDGHGNWLHKNIGLGHQMFWTTPESLHEHLPLVSERTQLAITADARIDNRNELFDKLDFGRITHEKVSDSQLILAAYECWGEECVQHLLGDFAFAIWDGDKQQLFCARDHFGVKPFYYFFNNTTFIFATEIKGILCNQMVPRELNEDKIAQYIALLFVNTTDCFFKWIHRLPPAHTMVITSHCKRINSYWSLDPKKTIHLKSDAEYDEAFREIFQEAVSCRLRSPYPIGSTLSGGMDSSSITCMARDLLAREGARRCLRTFSMIYEKFPQCDERYYMNAVIAQGGIDPHFVSNDMNSPFQSYIQAQRYSDEPYFGSTTYLWLEAYTAMRTQGIRTLLHGEGGDAVVSHGYGYLIELARSLHLTQLYRESQALYRELRARYGERVYKPIRIAWEHGFRPLIPEKLLNIRRRLYGITDVMRLLNHLPIDPDFAIRTNILAQCRAEEQDCHNRLSVREIQCDNITNGLIPFQFESTDCISAAYSLDIRYPFFDRRLVEFCLALPPVQKLHQGYTRAILHRAMRGILPIEVQQRTDKANLSPRFEAGIIEQDSTLISMVVDQHMSELLPYIDETKFINILREFLKDTRGVRGHWKSIWPAITLAAWFGTRSISHDRKEDNRIGDLVLHDT